MKDSEHVNDEEKGYVKKKSKKSKSRESSVEKIMNKPRYSINNLASNNKTQNDFNARSNQIMLESEDVKKIATTDQSIFKI